MRTKTRITTMDITKTFSDQELFNKREKGMEVRSFVKWQKTGKMITIQFGKENGSR